MLLQGEYHLKLIISPYPAVLPFPYVTTSHRGLLGVRDVSSCVESRDKLIIDHFVENWEGVLLGLKGNLLDKERKKINKAITTHLKEMLGMIQLESQMYGIFNICFLRTVIKTS